MGDVHYVPSGTSTVTKTGTTNASNTTASIALFRVTGDILVKKLYGVVTTALSSNHTAAHFRMNDGTNTPAITLATGTTLSSFGVGTLISKIAQVDVALTGTRSDQTRVVEAPLDNLTVHNEFAIVQKASTNSDVEYRYSTTNTPATGAIQFFMEYEPLSANGSVTVL